MEPFVRMHRQAYHRNRPETRANPAPPPKPQRIPDAPLGVKSRYRFFPACETLLTFTTIHVSTMTKRDHRKASLEEIRNLFDCGQFELVIQRLTQIVKSSPTFEAAYLLAESYRQLGEHHEAETVLDIIRERGMRPSSGE